MLLILHYITVHDVRRINTRGNEYTSPLDKGILTFVRQRVISWTPSKRFEYAMEKCVLILSDLNLVTGLGILISAYSQLDCGISAYHWQMVVFIAWFASFSFVSAMAFLEGYLQTNRNMRLIRIFFMCIFASLLIAALLPTGSSLWLNQYIGEGAGFYPGLSAVCFYKQLTMPSFLQRGPKLWSMIFSVTVVAISYIHCGIRLFDPTAEISRKYFRILPGSKFKSLMYSAERRVRHGGLQAYFWCVPYLVLYAAFTSIRAFFDIAESMLLEIIWLSFAMAWGTIKVWDTRAAAAYNHDGLSMTVNHEVLEENTWSFGQILPLVLLLLPLLSMAQAYLDNDAKAQETKDEGQRNERSTQEKGTASTSATVELGRGGTCDKTNETLPDPQTSTSCSITRCNHHPSVCPTRAQHVVDADNGRDNVEVTAQYSTSSASTPIPPTTSYAQARSLGLPSYPYPCFISHPWYKDNILLLLCQTFMVTAVVLWVLTALENILGISAILRNKVFLIWVLGVVPLASFVHLFMWYIASLIVSRWKGCEDWLKGSKRSMGKDRQDKQKWRMITVGEVVYWTLRLGLIGGCLAFTFFGSLELAGPKPLVFE